MTMYRLLICGCIWMASPAIANNSPPTDASIEQLLQLTDVRQLLDQVKLQVDGTMATAMRDALQGQSLTPERQAVIDRMRIKMAAVVTDALSWDKMLPIYVRTYRESLTQSELDGIITFYKSPAGQAFTKKMPLIIQNVMLEMHGLMKPVQQQLADIQKETRQELKDLKPSQGASTP